MAASVSKKRKTEWIFFGIVAAAAMLLVLFRRAYTISVQFGYEFLSYETWAELKIYLYLGLGIAALSLMVAWLKSR